MNARFEPREARRSAGKSFSTGDRRRLIFMAVLLVVVVAVFFELQKKVAPSPETKPAPAGAVPVRAALPPLDKQALKEVRDGTPEERVVLEPDAFRSVAAAARLLLPSHLRLAEGQVLPFDQIEERAAELRGKLFRHRGRLVAARQLRRSAADPPEYWCVLETDEGEQLLFASLTVPDELFGSENFVLADGLFLKIYSWTVDGERVTAPLVVGRRLVPSYRRAEPVLAPDPALLAGVRDPALTEDLPLDWEAEWHLLAAAVQAGRDAESIKQQFAGAPALDREAMRKFLNDPEFSAANRGKPWIIHCRVGDSWTEEIGENPQRLTHLTYGFAGNSDWGPALVEVVVPGRLELPRRGDRENYRALPGWYLQLSAYETTSGSRRRAPVFVVPGEISRTMSGTPSWVTEMLLAFIGLALLLGTFIVILIRRDRREAQRASAVLERLRHRVREKSKP